MVDPAPQVTIIVPVYNVEDYLPETLQSIAAQTVFSQCHVILVDDGSTDGSDLLAKQFAAEHPNVTALQQRNSGPGAARNLALDLADTPYVAFVDSDDLLPPRAIEVLLTAIVANKASISIGDMDTFPKRTAFLWKKPFGKGDRLLESVVDAPELIFDAGPCHKLYDLAQLRQHGLRFREGVHFEDAFLAIPMLLKAERIALVDSVVYNYRRRESGSSIMDNLFIREQNYWDHLELCETLANLRPELDVFRREVLERFLVRSYQGFAMRAHTLFDDAALWRIFEKCTQIYQDIDAAFIARWTADTRHRVAYLAFKSYDFDLFARPWERVHGVVACGGELHLDYPVTPALLPLTRVSAVSVRLEQVRLTESGEALKVSGHVQINGLPMHRPIRTPLALRLRGGKLTVPATLERRSDLKSADDSREWSGFAAEVPVAQLRTGNHLLRLVFLTETGQASRQCLISAAYLRDAPMKRSGDTRILPGFAGRENATLLVQRASGAEGRRRWHRMLVRKDLRHVVSRRPFWKQRLLRLLTEPFMRGRDVWLVGERKDTAQDNSWHLFRHLRKVERRRNAYYVIASDSPDRERLQWARQRRQVRLVPAQVPHAPCHQVDQLVRHRLVHAAVHLGARAVPEAPQLADRPSPRLPPARRHGQGRQRRVAPGQDRRRPLRRGSRSGGRVRVEAVRLRRRGPAAGLPALRRTGSGPGWAANSADAHLAQLPGQPVLQPVAAPPVPVRHLRVRTLPERVVR